MSVAELMLEIIVVDILVAKLIVAEIVVLGRLAGGDQKSVRPASRRQAIRVRIP